MKVNIGLAKASLGELIDGALAGEEIIICRAGEPLVRLVPYQHSRWVSEPGAVGNTYWSG